MSSRFRKFLSNIGKPALSFLKDEQEESFYLNGKYIFHAMELEDIYEKTPFPLLWLDKEGRILWLNGPASSLLSLSKKEAQHQLFQTLFIEPSKQSRFSTSLLNEESITNLSFSFRGSSGYLRNLILSAHPVWKEGTFLHYRLYLQESSPVLPSLETPVSGLPSEILHKNILDLSQEGIMAYAALRDATSRIYDFICTYANPASAGFTGKSVNETEGRKLSEIWAECKPLEIIQKYSRLVEEDLSYSYENAFYLVGNERWFHARSSKMNDGYVIRFADITEKRKSEIQISSVLRNSINGLVVYTPVIEDERVVDFEILLTNEYASKLWGIPSDKLKGGRLLQVNPYLATNDYFNNLVEVWSSGIPLTEERLFSRDNEELWFLYQISRTEDVISVNFIEITDQHETQTRLQTTNLLLHESQSLANLASWQYDIQSQSLTASPELYRLLHLDENSFPSTVQSFVSLVDPDRLNSIHALGSFGEKGDSISTDLRLLTATGYRTFACKSRQVRNSEGVPIKILGIVQDIEEKIEQELFIRQITNTAPGIIAVFDLKEEKFLFLNDGMYNMLGYSSQELLSSEPGFFLSRVHSEDREILIKGNREFLENQQKKNSGLHEDKAFRIEYRVLNAKDEYRWMSTTSIVFKRDQNGLPEQLLNISTDITPFKIAESELKEKRHLLEQITRNTPNMLYLFDIRANRMTYINDAVLSILGYLPEAFLNNQENFFETYFHPDDVRRLWSRDRKKVAELKDEDVAGFEYRLKHKDGGWRWMYTKERVFRRNEKGQVTEILGIAEDITERRLQENLLLESKLKFEAVFNQSFQLISILSPDGLILESNMQALPFQDTGKTAGGIYFHELSVHRNPERIREIIAMAAEGQIINEEIQTAYPDGGLRFVDFSLKPVSNSEGHILWLVAEGRDITERRQNEEELKRSRQLLLQAEEMAHHGSWEIDLTNSKMFWSEELYRILCFDPEKDTASADLFLQRVHESDRVALRQNLEQRKDDSFCLEHRIVLPDGTLRMLSTKGKTITEKGRLKIMGSVIDITEQKLAYEHLLNSQQLYKSLAGNIPESVVLLFDSNLIISLADGAALENLEKSLEPYGGQVSALFNDPLFHSIREAAQEVFLGKERKQEIHLPGIIYAVETFLVKNVDGTITTGILFLREITEIKKYQEELELRISELNRSNKNLEQFAYVASHDLQEPLRKIRTFGGRLTDKYREALGLDGKDFLDRMQNAAQRMQVMIDDLLSFSRLSKGEEAFEATALSDIIGQVINDFEITIEQKKAVITYDRLPVIDALPGQMQQLFQNLLSNALKFSREGEYPVIRITHELVAHIESSGLSRQKNLKYCHVHFSDNGIGFDERYAERIFTIFQRLHGRSDYAGTGIGLAVCKKIAENHGGHILVKSKENEGSTFTVVLPLKHKSHQQQLSLSLN